ncbi:MAG: hypothetical protein HY361_02325 [Candidatus Aenigmarchaeota archaeon]|nr:hypothetical protein [Candidatus Aenigmarchaeota archaeon]
MIGKIISAFLLLVPASLAQADKETTIGVLRGLLGNLPSSCSDITSALCIYCLGYVKLLPLAFFFGLFYLVLNIAVKPFARVEALAQAPSIRIGIILISLSLAFFTIQNTTVGGALSRLGTFSDWTVGLLILVGISVSAFFGFRILNAMISSPSIGSNPIWILAILVLTLIIIGVFVGYVTTFVGGPLQIIIVLFSTMSVLVIAVSLFAEPLRTFFAILLFATFIILIMILTHPNEFANFLPELFQESEEFNLGICA